LTSRYPLCASQLYTVFRIPQGFQEVGVLAVVRSDCSDILVDLEELSKACIRDRPTVRIQQGGMNETAMSIDLLIYG
jgi:hypothetical protein